MVTDTGSIFRMCILCGKTFSFVPRSSVKVKYQGHILKDYFSIGHKFSMPSYKAFIFHICIPCV